MITILHHLGLGDAIMLNGMVRHFAEMEEVCIFVQKQHLVSVEFMYRDIKDRVKIKTVNTTNAQDMWSQVEGKVFYLNICTPNLRLLGINPVRSNVNMMTTYSFMMIYHGV